MLHVATGHFLIPLFSECYEALTGTLQEGYQGVELQVGPTATAPARNKKHRGPYATSRDAYAPLEDSRSEPQEGLMGAPREEPLDRS